MHLLHTRRLELQEFIGDDIPKYAILSHTWGDQEVLFRHVRKKVPSKRTEGTCKVRKACSLAVKDGWDYIWVDTCCINKESSAELSEAINSMYQWYKASEVCYVFLADVSTTVKKLTESRWFTRGWTLQELLAPRLVEFYDQDWHYLACKDLRNKNLLLYPYLFQRESELDPSAPVTHALAFLAEIAEVTSIKVLHLLDEGTVSIAQKMSWVGNRQTKRGEDTAYCMLGLFDVNMPLLYGEGKAKAFLRLQSEILKVSYDDSIFAWNNPNLWSSGLLAHSPHDFIGCGDIRFRHGGRTSRRPSSLTSLGVEMALPACGAHGDPDPIRLMKPYFIALSCQRSKNLLMLRQNPERPDVFLQIQFCHQDSEESGAERALVRDQSLIVARRTSLAYGLDARDASILRGDVMHQVFFPQTKHDKPSSWKTLNIGPISWSPEYETLLRSALSAPPTINFKLAHSMTSWFGKSLKATLLHRDSNYGQEGPQRIGFPLGGTDVSSSSHWVKDPCGLQLDVPHPSIKSSFLFRWCRDVDETPSIEISRFERGDLTELANSWLPMFDGQSVHSSRTTDKDKKPVQDRTSSKAETSSEANKNRIISTDLLRQGDTLAFRVKNLDTWSTIWISFSDHRLQEKEKEWTIEIDITDSEPMYGIDTNDLYIYMSPVHKLPSATTSLTALGTRR